jgi:ABC-type lipoprotein export system ATPase subunit
VKDSTLITMRGVTCDRTGSDTPARVNDVSLSIRRGTVTLLTGDTGCGKNLLLRLLGLLDEPDAGEIFFDGNPTASLTQQARANLRTRNCGYVFASPFLLPAFTVLENIAMPIFKICQLNPEQARDRTEDLMQFAGLDAVASVKNVEPRLQYRVSLARALASQPAAIFVENLDTLLAEQDVEEFRGLLHRAALRYDVAIVASASCRCGVRHEERRVAMEAGRLAGSLES